ncbi:Hypothetical protein PHPALM_365 [Phytophthora palmivora]|uniref:Uncharacterized protein n=1 Tax=Phytophthora palmivora TaxID=4796 RepID=A0A2P4YV01_9STRA|nr:Hypothetical protein PHPALM_365 [Phytophthora palmivora]
MNIHVITTANHVYTCYGRHTLQLAIIYTKYYKSLFLRRIDIAVKKINHVNFLKEFHVELGYLRDEDWQVLRNIASATLSGGVGSSPMPVGKSMLNSLTQKEDINEYARCVRYERVMTMYKVDISLSVAAPSSVRHPQNGRRCDGVSCAINHATNTTTHLLPALICGTTTKRPSGAEALLSVS